MYASLYKNVLRFVLKESNEGESRISHGTKFHRIGPAFKKARSPKETDSNNITTKIDRAIATACANYSYPNNDGQI